VGEDDSAEEQKGLPRMPKEEQLRSLGKL